MRNVSPGSSRSFAVAGFLALLALACLAAYFLLRPRAPSTQRTEEAIKQFAAGRGDSIVVDVARFSPSERLAILALPLTKHISVGDVATDETLASGPVVIKRPVVTMIERIVTEMTAASPAARLVVSNGWRPAVLDKSVGGTGSGPHLRGDCLDVAFDVPGLSSRASAVRVADVAYQSGAKGIALLNDADRFLVHCDAVRTDPWYVEQVWQAIETAQGEKWVTFYQGVDPRKWAQSAVPDGADELAGDWMATSIISGKKVVNGSMKSGPMHITVYRRPNGHYGMRIPGDQLPDVTALWDAERKAPGLFVVRYRWPQKPPDKGVEKFEGTVEVKNGIALRNTTQTNAAYPGESTHVNARWVRIAPGRRGPDPELSWHDGALYSHGKPCPRGDATASGGQFIDPALFDGRTYRESAPAFEAGHSK